MRLKQRNAKTLLTGNRATAWLAFLCLSLTSFGANAQEAAPEPQLTTAELETLVAPLALYPDDLLAIMLPAATYPLQIVEASRFLNDRESDPSLAPDEAWDDSIVALLNYPEALELLNDDLDWTWSLGATVLAQQAEVLEAIEAFRDEAYLAGNLESDEYQVVERNDEGIRIVPADPEVIYVPYYDPVYVTVRSPYRAYYYHDRGYPLYYYPYDVGHRFYGSLFWGVSTAFSIHWRSRYLHLYYYDHYRHPFYGRHYHNARYYRHRRSIDHHVFVGGVHQRHRGDYYRWHPSRYHGNRPGHNRYSRGSNRKVLTYNRQGLTPRAERARRINNSRRYANRPDSVVQRDRNATRSNRSNRRTDNRTDRNQRRGTRATESAATGNRSNSNRLTRRTNDANGARDRSNNVRRFASSSDQRNRSQRPDTRADGNAQRNNRGLTRNGNSNRTERPTTRRATPTIERASRFTNRSVERNRNAQRPAQRNATRPSANSSRQASARENRARFSTQRPRSTTQRSNRATRPSVSRPQVRSERRNESRPAVRNAPRQSRPATRSAPRQSRSATRSAPRQSRPARASRSESRAPSRSSRSSRSSERRSTRRSR